MVNPGLSASAVWSGSDLVITITSTANFDAVDRFRVLFENNGSRVGTFPLLAGDQTRIVLDAHHFRAGSGIGKKTFSIEIEGDDLPENWDHFGIQCAQLFGGSQAAWSSVGNAATEWTGWIDAPAKISDTVVVVGVEKRRRKPMTLINIERDALFVPNHDAPAVVTPTTARDITQSSWSVASDGMAHVDVGIFHYNGNFSIAAGKVYSVGVHVALPDDTGDFIPYRVRAGGFCLGGLKLCPFVGEPTTALVSTAAGNVVSCKPFGLADELLGFSEFVETRPSEGRTLTFAVGFLNPTSGAVNAEVKIIGSLQRMDVAPPRMAAAVR